MVVVVKSATEREDVHHADYHIGIDLAKTVFQIHAVDADGATVIRKRLRRAESFVSGLEPMRIRFRPKHLDVGQGCDARAVLSFLKISDQRGPKNAPPVVMELRRKTLAHRALAISVLNPPDRQPSFAYFR
jgi:hypothetical protein